MEHVVKKISVVFCGLALALSINGGVYAAFLKFDQSSFTVSEGDTFDVQIIVNPGSDQITSVDAYITYDEAVLSADSVTDGTYFPTVLNDLSEGKAYVAGFVNSPSDFKTGTGTVATVTFSAQKVGTTDLVFDCDGQATVTSKVIKNDINSTNIITCSQNGTATVTVKVAGSTTTTNTTTTSDPTSTPTPTKQQATSLPASGSTETMMMVGLIGVALVAVGSIAKFIRPY